MEPRLTVARKISSLLRKNGTLIISEVNAYNPFVQVLLFKRRRFKTVKKITLENGSHLIYGNERIIPHRVAITLFTENRLKIKSFRRFRLFSAYLSKLFDHDGTDLMELEKRFIKIAPLSKIFTLHYNLVFQK